MGLKENILSHSEWKALSSWGFSSFLQDCMGVRHPSYLYRLCCLNVKAIILATDPLLICLCLLFSTLLQLGRGFFCLLPLNVAFCFFTWLSDWPWIDWPLFHVCCHQALPEWNPLQRSHLWYFLPNIPPWFWCPFVYLLPYVGYDSESLKLRLLRS